MKQTIIFLLLAVVTMTVQAQKHLPEIRYDSKPAVLSGHIIGAEKPSTLHLRSMKRYCSGMPLDGLWREEVTLDSNGQFQTSIPVNMTNSCTVRFGGQQFSLFVVPGKKVSFTLNLQQLQLEGLAEALTFGGELARFNHDLVYATEKGIDPISIYDEMEDKRNTGQLLNELPEKSEQGYFDYLDATRHRIDKMLDAEEHIGTAYREFAKAVNLYMYGSMIPFCGQSIQYAGILDDEAAYDAFEARLRSRCDRYMQGDPWANPLLSYVMWGDADMFIAHYVSRPVKLPDSYWKCWYASKYLAQIEKEKTLLSEAQKDSLQTLMSELSAEVLAHNDRLEQELSFVSEQEMSRICSLPDEAASTDDILSLLLKPYRGRPVLLDLWETTCGPCRMAFKEMHEKKKELADRIHFVNVASDRSDLATWQRLVPNYIGDHFRLTGQQLQALHRQIPCDTNGIPLWVIINADGTIHHAFVGYSNLDSMMKEINQVLQ